METYSTGKGEPHSQARLVSPHNQIRTLRGYNPFMPQLETITLSSKALGRTQPVAIFPPDMLTAEGRCYSLMMLHGMGGDYLSWPSNSRIAELVAGLPIVVVMPSAGDSFYIDSEVDLMETFLCGELLPDIDKRFPTITSARGRGVTGLSMGGYGALLLALRRADLFGSAASHSGAVLTSRATTEVGIKWELADKLYGVDSAGERKRRDHDIFFQAQRYQTVDTESSELCYHGPSLYLDCGQDDFLFYASRHLTDAFRMQQIPYEYHEFPGEHDWAYWNAHVADSLRFHLRCWML